MLSCILIGQFGASIFDAISESQSRAHGSDIRQSRELLDEYPKLATDGANVIDMLGANQQFIDAELAAITRKWRERRRRLELTAFSSPD